MAQRKMPVVEVEWVDSCTMAGWYRPEVWANPENHSYSVCRTAGYLFAKTKDAVTVMLSQSDSGSMADGMTIPRSAVKSITVLKP